MQTIVIRGHFDSAKHLVQLYRLQIRFNIVITARDKTRGADLDDSMHYRVPPARHTENDHVTRTQIFFGWPDEEQLTIAEGCLHTWSVIDENPGVSFRFQYRGEEINFL